MYRLILAAVVLFIWFFVECFFWVDNALDLDAYVVSVWVIKLALLLTGLWLLCIAI